MNIYVVRYRIPDGGRYSAEGGYYHDVHDHELIICDNANIAREAVKALWPQAVITKVAKLCSANKPAHTRRT